MKKSILIIIYCCSIQNENKNKSQQYVILNTNIGNQLFSFHLTENILTV